MVPEVCRKYLMGDGWVADKEEKLKKLVEMSRTCGNCDEPATLAALLFQRKLCASCLDEMVANLALAC